jgi:sugar lactone lactonase YvrE
MVYVFAPSGRVIETQPLPVDTAPTNVAFGDLGLTSVYVTTTNGHVYRARNSGRRGHAVWPKA